MPDEYFKEALSNFMKDSANGGAIRHLYDLGKTPEEIQKELLFPADISEIEAVISNYQKEKEEPDSAYKIVKEQNKYGKTTFRKVKKEAR